jgi:dienelactone hydrolase
MIHGGPFGVDNDSWEESWAYPVNLVAQRGAFVLRPNYHGSSSYGLKFAESIAGGKYYDLPLEDIDKGVDALIARGMVDPAKLATTGWSNGAILSAALIVKDQRYKAASLGAGGAEWVADWGACEFGLSFSNYYLGKSPLEDPQLYLKMAPLYQFDKIKTPTIIFQGDSDRAVPPHHGWAQFRVLQQLGKVDVRFIQFPGEPHSLEKLAHQRRKLTEELAWLDKYLFTSYKEDNLALKSGSPLALALKRKGAKRDGTRYGVRVKGVLVPETVAFEGLQVGRFEVTLAQYAAFDKNYKVEPGKENYPMTGLTFEQAQAYCRWLTLQTGETYRLPTEEEGSVLYEDRDKDGENTLDHWAGYKVNPDDARRLQDQAKELDGRAPLLREVGQFKGEGDDPVFDLGGNAAEWVHAARDKGKVMGGSAATPADDRGGIPCPPEYVGFRVIKVKP